MAALVAVADVRGISDLISMVGFPIFCTLALGWFIYKAFDKITTRNKEREEALYHVITAVREQLIKATEINASFVEVLSDLKSDLSKVQDDIDEIKTGLSREGE